MHEAELGEKQDHTQFWLCVNEVINERTHEVKTEDRRDAPQTR